MAKKQKTLGSVKRRRFRKVVIFFEVLCMLVMTLGAYAYSKVENLNIVEIDRSQIVVNEEINEEILTGYTNIVLFGVDSRSGRLDAQTNSDTMIIVSINNESGEIKMASLYRDTYIDIGNGGYAKANAAYSYGGPEQALSMLNKSLDLNLDKYVTADFTALATAITYIGGLDLEMTSEEVYWTNAYIGETSLVTGMGSPQLEVNDSGVYHVNGLQATAFCRIRYTEGDDYKRTERQRYVLTKIFEKCKTMNLSSLNDIANHVFPMIQTNITLAEMMRIGTRVLGFSMGETIGLPEAKTNGDVGNNGDCVIATNWTQDAINVHRILYNDNNYSPSSVVISIASQMANAPITPKSESSGYEQNYYDDGGYDDGGYDDGGYDDGGYDDGGYDGGGYDDGGYDDGGEGGE